MALTVTRGKRKPYTVEPLPDDAPSADPGPLPEAWATWTPEERGENRARLGAASLRAWFMSLTTAERQRLKPTLDRDWKPIAEQVTT
jgi:hypothetical protein